MWVYTLDIGANVNPEHGVRTVFSPKFLVGSYSEKCHGDVLFLGVVVFLFYRGSYFNPNPLCASLIRTLTAAASCRHVVDVFWAAESCNCCWPCRR